MKKNQAIYLIKDFTNGINTIPLKPYSKSIYKINFSKNDLKNTKLGRDFKEWVNTELNNNKVYSPYKATAFFDIKNQQIMFLITIYKNGIRKEISKQIKYFYENKEQKKMNNTLKEIQFTYKGKTYTAEGLFIGNNNYSIELDIKDMEYTPLGQMFTDWVIHNTNIENEATEMILNINDSLLSFYNPIDKATSEKFSVKLS